VQLAIVLPELVNAQDPIISKLNRFTEVNVSSAYNDNDGYQNVSNHPNYDAFATIQAVVLSILKPAGSAGATVQLAIVLPELLKVRFIQLILLLLSLKPMEQSQCGVPQILEAQVHPLAPP
jgi:hypothetical protein